jgi:hypothetical protein
MLARYFCDVRNLQIYTNNFETAISTELVLFLGKATSTPLMIVKTHAKHAHKQSLSIKQYKWLPYEYCSAQHKLFDFNGS